MVVSSVAASVAASSGNASNPQQIQNNMNIGYKFGQELQQSLPDAYQVQDGNGVDIALATKIAEYIQSSKKPTNDGRNVRISISAPVWELAYVSLLLSSNYALNYKFDMRLNEQKEGKIQLLKTISFTKTYAEKMPLDAWRADHHAAVNRSAEKIINECFNQFLEEAGLQP